MASSGTRRSYRWVLNRSGVPRSFSAAMREMRSNRPPFEPGLPGLRGDIQIQKERYGRVLIAREFARPAARRCGRLPSSLHDGRSRGIRRAGCGKSRCRGPDDSIRFPRRSPRGGSRNPPEDRSRGRPEPRERDGCEPAGAQNRRENGSQKEGIVFVDSPPLEPESTGSSRMPRPGITGT